MMEMNPLEILSEKIGLSPLSTVLVLGGFLIITFGIKILQMNKRDKTDCSGE